MAIYQDTQPVDGGKAPPPWPKDAARALRLELDQRIVAMTAERYSWWQHWRELADYILPRRYRWLITQNQYNRGSPINGRILNSTTTLAARNCAAGIMSGMTSPGRPWFHMRVPNDELMQDVEVQEWCEAVTQKIQEIMAGSNYYTAKATQFLDLVVFGTAPMIIYEHQDRVIRCFNPCAGEYFCAVGPDGDVNTLAREYTQKASALAKEFGKERVGETVNAALRNRGSGSDRDFIVRHVIEPNPDYLPANESVGPGVTGLPRMFKYRETYWLAGVATDELLRHTGFLEQPFGVPRWDISSLDAYGRSPAMDALGDTKQLQLMEKRKAQAIDKIVNPPMVADVSMKNEPASLLPGAITYVPGLSNSIGFKPAFTISPNIRDLSEDIAKVEARIKDAMFNDLFLMISQLDTVRSATEIDARREEKLGMIGPAMDRLQRESLHADIVRIFSIGARRGLFPPPPEAMQGQSVKIEYVSLLADLQRSAQTTAIERVWGFAGTIGAAKPEAIDNLDADATIRRYAELMRAPPSIITDAKQMAATRAARNQQQQQAAALQVGAEAAQAGKVLSETDVGGGQNALAAMLGG